MKNEITINGVTYVAKDSKPEGNRCVVVVDRGWIFAGDVTRENGRIKISRAVSVFRWESIDFAGVVANPKKADIRKIDDIDMPEGSEVFCIPVKSDWGL